MFCPRCGTGALPDQRFCKNCGAALPTAQNPQVVAAAASEPIVQAPPQPPIAPPPEAPSQPSPAVEQAPQAPPQPPVAPLQPPPVLTHAIPDGGFTIEDLVAWLQSEGYSAKVVTGNDGERHVVSNTQGSPCNIFLWDCNGDRCASISLGAGFATNGKFDTSHINDWNINNRWGRAYYDSVNDPWLVMDIDLWPGGTYESLRDQFGAWNNTLARFINKYNLR